MSPPRPPIYGLDTTMTEGFAGRRGSLPFHEGDNNTCNTADSSKKRAKAEVRHHPPSTGVSLITSALQNTDIAATSRLQATPASGGHPTTLLERRSTKRESTTIPNNIALPSSALQQGPQSPVFAPHSASNPIPIPPRHTTDSRPTTPLTGRDEKGGHQFPFFETTPEKPQISQSLRPSYRRKIERPVNLGLTPLQTGFFDRSSTSKMRPDQNSSQYTPTSPLSTTAATSALPPSQSTNNARRAPRSDLRLNPLPRFHPAVYQSPNTSNANSPTRSRPPSTLRSPRSPPFQPRQFASAQQKIFQYQRELLIPGTHTAGRPAASSRKIETPKAPSLVPMGSPGAGPATPMMLEEKGDYMTRGAQLGEGSPREFVDKLIRDEHERRNGMRSASGSPAVSPAGGCI